MKKNIVIKPLIFVLLIVAIFFVIKTWNLTRFFELEYTKTQILVWKQQLEDNKLIFMFVYFIMYVFVTALSIPGAAVLSLVAGALFGLILGTLVVSFASTIGATLAFLFVRFFLRDTIEKRFSKQYTKINAGIEKDGALYLFALRLVPVFPFFIINIGMALTKIPVLVFMFVSQIGMLAGTAVYVNAGKQLATITDVSNLLSGRLLGAFALLAIFPFLSKRLLAIVKSKKSYEGFKKPTSFDANLVVIGAGTAGLISAYIAASVKSTVYLIEKDEMGGDCLNRGCVPSKAILSSSKYAHMYLESAKHGVKYQKPQVLFSSVMKGVHQAIESIAPNDSVERYEKLGVTCIKGTAKIISPWEVQVKNKTIKTKSIIIATGGRPVIPDIPRLDISKALTSDTVWTLKQQPATLVIIGGGPIGCELACAFARLGTKVTVVQRADRLLMREETEASECARDILERLQVTVYTGHVPVTVKNTNKKTLIIADKNGEEKKLPFEKILFAAGRKASVDNLTEGSVKIELNDNGTINTDEYLRTNYPNIFAAGDVVGTHQFTHFASHMAWYASINALFGRIKLTAVDYSLVPAVTFLSPEIARVGITEEQARKQNLEYETSMYHMKESDRAIAEQKTQGFIKVITQGKTDKILGVTIVAERAGEMLGEFILAMKHNIGLNKILATIHPYPTYIESVKAVAGVWKKKRIPHKLLVMVQKLFYMGLHKSHEIDTK